METINEVIAKRREWRDLKRDNLDYFIMKNTKFPSFYHLPNTHKRLHNVPRRPVITNGGHSAESISSFLDHDLRPLAQAVKCYIKDTNELLEKLRSVPKFPGRMIYVL